MVAEADPETALRLLSATREWRRRMEAPVPPCRWASVEAATEASRAASAVKLSPGFEQKGASFRLMELWRWLSAAPVPSDHFKLAREYAGR